MEESTEAHMETDVSSTTEDVPETQEVTGSNGSVEMVIVVEKVNEEEVSKNIEKESDNDHSTPKAPETPPPMDTSPEVPETKSPIKDAEPEQSPQPIAAKPESPDNTSTEDPPTNTEESSSKQTIPEEADTNNKMEKPKVQNDNCHEISDDILEVVLVMPSDKTKVEPLSKEALSLPGFTVKKICEPDKINSTNSVEVKKKPEPTVVNNILHLDMTVDTSNDSHSESNLDISEREHNKSISRELKSLINSAKESKIISECTQLTSKTRKSRNALDISSSSLNSSVDGEKIHGVRRNSNNSQKSNCSEKSEKVALKRSMRSQNPEFVSKVKQFLNSVTGKSSKEDDMTDDEMEEKSQTKNDQTVSTTSTPKKRKLEEIVMNKSTKLRSDSYCWRCHWAVEQSSSEKAHGPMLCTVCPRSFHFKCLSGAERNRISAEKSWVCPDCLIVLQAESSETRSSAMKKISLGMLCDLLKFALERMMDLNGVEPFLTPVDRAEFPDYDKYVVHPMDLSQMNANIADGLYGSTESFLGDAQWILHNSIIFNAPGAVQSKLTGGARALVRSCRAEMGEIEACPECYAAAHARRPTWFTDVCSSPHILLWAKLKGFPYWPAKGMSVSGAGLVDVRFFGAHDRAWVPSKDCFLYSEKDPNNFRTKRQDILDSMQEAEQHIRNISRKYGKFVYPPFKTQFEPQKLNQQLKMMIPSFEGEVRPVKRDKSSNGSPSLSNDKSRSNSKSSKSSVNDSDISEAEDPLALPQNKIVDPVSNMEEDFSTETHIKIVEVEVPKAKENKETENTNTKKRPRPGLEEAIFTVLDGCIEEKRTRLNDKKPDKTTSDAPEMSKSRGTRERHKSTKDNEESATPSSSKADAPSSSTPKDKLTVAPLKISIASAKNGKQTVKVTSPTDSPKASTSSDRSLLIVRNTSTQKEEKPATIKQRQKADKSLDKSKDEKMKSLKRRNSKSSRSSSGASGSRASTGAANAVKADKPAPENKIERLDEPSTSGKEKTKVYVAARSKAVGTDKNEKSTSTANTTTGTERTNLNDKTSLAVLARDTKSNPISNSSTGLPTISSVRSLSTFAQNSNTTTTNSTNTPKTIEVTIEANPDSSIFTPTSTDNIKSIKDAAAKLQKLRGDVEPLVGKVGVRAFARMRSPEKQRNNEVEVEVKAEPIDLDDADRHMEKMDLMNAFKLRPVNPPSNLREVVITPLNRKAPTKPPEIRPRAKKTFPHPKKPEDGQLNGKNSMVYIPIQPPMTQAPLRHQRPNPMPIVTAGPRPANPINNNNNTGSIVNTVTTPLLPLLPPLGGAGPSSAPGVSVASIGHVPTTVHTVPLMTSVNGQWMFSLQPVMSVGGVDYMPVQSTPSPPLVNGITERGATLVQATVMSPAPPAVATPPALAAPPAPATPAAPAASPLCSVAPTPKATAVATQTNADTTPPGEPPRLQQRPLLNPFDSNTPIAILPAPSTAGPLTAKLNQNAAKLTDFFRTLLEDSLEKLDEPSAQAAALRVQLEQARWKYTQQLEELKHNHELTIAEMRASFEKEKARMQSDARRAAQQELDAAVKHTKSKQWCANCSQEAQYYCCWNTAYCDYPCQRAHWTQHFLVCTQNKSQDWRKGKDGSSQPDSRLQPQPDNMPALQKSTAAAAAAVTVGGKLAAQRPFAHDNGQKTSIIMSMVEDNSGNQTVKCVGTYSSQKAPTSPTATATPTGQPTVNVTTVINPQLPVEEAGKKVVTSGGYLIVGAPPSARRMHTIQYYS